jgi:hypothetical protein
MSSSETASNIGKTTDPSSIGNINRASIDDKLLKNAQVKPPLATALAADGESTGSSYGETNRDFSGSKSRADLQRMNRAGDGRSKFFTTHTHH